MESSRILENCIKRSQFKEAEEALDIISQLISTKPLIASNEITEYTAHCIDILDSEDIKHQRLLIILKEYLEQPKLLDSHLENMIRPLLLHLSQHLELLETINQIISSKQPTILKDDRHLFFTRLNEDTRSELISVFSSHYQLCNLSTNYFQIQLCLLRLIQTIHTMSSILYTMCIVRRPKVALRMFLTDVHYLELIIITIEQLTSQQTTTNNLSALNILPSFSLLSLHTNDPISQIDLRSNITHEDTAWMLLYVSLTWCSLLILVPFTFQSFGQYPGQHGQQFTLLDRVIHIIQMCLTFPTGGIQKVTTMLGSTIFRRPDIYQTVFPRQFISWVCSIFSKTLPPPTPSILNGNQIVELCITSEDIGSLRTLKSILRSGSRTGLSPFISDIAKLLFKDIPNLFLTSSHACSIQLTKYHTAAIARLMCVILPSTPATWRYIWIKKKMLFGQLDSASTDSSHTVSYNENTIIPETFQEWIEIGTDLLLQRLDHQNTSIRWTAAKGLSDVVMYLPFEFSNQIIQSVIDLFQVSDVQDSNLNCTHSTMINEHSWNGACLTLAEFIRKGCILPNRLSQIIGPLCKAASYDPVLPTHQQNSAAIRDAACFVCWAIARAYPPNSLLPFVSELTSAFITVALFDRDINCRRAASAAIQEHVGRQGLFPHGIPLVTIADYFSLATTRLSYLIAAPQIAAFQEYQEPILNCLIQIKLRHTNRYIREIGARSLRLVSVHCPTNCVLHWITILENRVIEGTNDDRHGALLGLSGLIESLSERDDSHAITIGSQTLIIRLRNLIPKMEKVRCYRGRGGELTREAACRFLGTLSSATKLIPFNNNTAQRYFISLFECVRHLVHQVQLSAVEALHLLALNRATTFELTEWVDKIMECLSSSGEHVAARRGLVMALAAFSTGSSIMLNKILKTLCYEAINLAPNNNKELRDAETRQAAVVSLSFIIRSLYTTTSAETPTIQRENKLFQTHDSNENTDNSSTNGSTVTYNLLQTYDNDINQLQIKSESLPWDMICTTLRTAATDYEIDKRGDVGSWVRDAACEVITFILDTALCTTQDNVIPITTKHIYILFCHLLRQTVDRLNRTRGRATYLIYRLCMQLYVQSINKISSNDSHNKSNVHLPSFTPEFIFRRVYYGYPYELLTLNILPDTSYFLILNDSVKFNDLQLPLGQLTNIKTIMTIFFKIAHPNNATEKTNFTTNLSNKIEASISHCLVNENTTQNPQSISEDVHENHNSLDIDIIQTAGSGVASFICWDSYNYASQRFQKSSVTLKLQEFNNATQVFNSILPLLLQKPYRLCILAGVTNSIGVSLGSVSNEASTALLWTLQDPLLPIEIINHLRRWITQTLSIAAAAEISKRQMFLTTNKITIHATNDEWNIDSNSDIVSAFKGVSISSIFRVMALLLCNDAADIEYAEQTLDAACQAVKISGNMETLRTAIDFCASYAVSNNSTFEKNAECIELRKKALTTCVSSLKHMYPSIRQHTCQQLYARFMLLSDDDISSLFGYEFKCSLSNLLAMLIETSWHSLQNYSELDSADTNHEVDLKNIDIGEMNKLNVNVAVTILQDILCL